jgi:hypothetical protein
MLGNNILFDTILLYRGSRDGWMYKNFHDRCDNKGPTICFFNIKDGDVIGGFTNASWSSSSFKYVGDSDAILFNLNLSIFYPSMKNGKEIICYSELGPCFSGGSLP